jgi:LDH2 family malate/lactate/ureidoglycolate dehydrogenase
MNRDEALERLVRLGLTDQDAAVVADHFDEAERRGKHGHGFSRLPWLERQPFSFGAQPRQGRREGCLERWDGNGALGYVTLARICDAVLAEPPEPVRLVVAADCFPTGALGFYVRRLAAWGLLGVLTATSPARLAHPSGGPPLAGTNPLAIGVPSSDGDPVVVDVSMGAVTYGDVLAGRARPEQLVPFGGEQAHKAFALAIGLQLVVDTLVPEGYGAVLLAVRPAADPVPALRTAAAGVRLPGSP